jgi:hypothetical protein
MSTISITKPNTANLPHVAPLRHQRLVLEAMFAPRSGAVMSGNSGMQKICRKAGLQLHRLPNGDCVANLLLPGYFAALKRRIK